MRTDCCDKKDPCRGVQNPCGCKFEMPASCVHIDTSCLEDIKVIPGDDVEKALCSIYNYIKETEYYIPNKIKIVEFPGSEVSGGSLDNKYYEIQDSVIEVDKVHYEGVLLPSRMWGFTYPNKVEFRLDAEANLQIEGNDQFIIEYQVSP